jgi:hypothetical protein
MSNSPTYIVKADKSKVTGKISFEAREDGYYGIILLSNFPEGYIKKYEIGTAPITEPNYETLKTTVLKYAQEYLDEFKPETDFGTLKIISSAEEPATRYSEYKLIGKVVDIEDMPIPDAIIKDTLGNLAYSQVNGNFILLGDYIDNSKDTKKNKYIVIKGDTLYGIARKNPIEGFTEAQMVEKIYQANINLLEGRSTTSTTGKLLENEDLIYPGDVLTLPVATSKSILPFTINVSKEGYGQVRKKPFNQDGSLKNDIGIIRLIPSSIDLKESIKQEIPIPEPQIQAMRISKMNFEMAQQTAMNRVISTIKMTLLPAILTQLAEFGITKASEALGEKFGDLNITCPANIDELNRIINRKNRLVKALNNIYNFLKTVKIGVEIADKVLLASEIVVITLQALASIPSTVATPIPSSVSNVVEEIKRQIKKYKLISSSTLLVLSILIELINRVLQYLSLLDNLIQECALEKSLPQEQISEDLLLSTQQQSQQLSPVVTNVNGFEMDVISEDGETDYDLKRRRAVAKNKSGIIMLKGEPSFSSNDQILIDELVFYIQQNDLKAE